MRTVPGPTSSVVVVGAGLGGLSAALHLAGAGRSVTVVERAPLVGGRAGVRHDHGYVFDTGPAVLTMPEIIDDTFAAVGEHRRDWLTLTRLDPAYRARFADGSTIDMHADASAMHDEIAATCSTRDADAYLRHVAWLRRLYDLQMPNFIDRNLDTPLAVISRPLAQLVLLGGFGRLGRRVARTFADERLRRLFSFQAMYAGLAPADALAIYAVISYLDSVRGVYFPDGGMHAVPQAMAAAAAAHGVTFRLGTEVRRIEVAGGRAQAVHTADGERIGADVVVVNADLPVAYQRLLPPGYRPRRLRRLRYSPSAVVLLAGSAQEYPDLAHHNLDFGAAWDRTFDQIIRRGEPMSDPSFFLTNATRTDPSLAPAGRHTYYALFPTPHLQHRRPIDWIAQGRSYRDHIVATLEARGYAGFGAGIETEHLITPADWQAQGIAAGAPFAAAHTFAQTGPFRAPTLDRAVENLVFCGSNTQPGVGVPMVLLSGRLAAERITGRHVPGTRTTAGGSR
jgi:phytoene desaturase